MKVEIEFPKIEGHEYTGEYRRPKKGEIYLDCDFIPSQCKYDIVESTYPILKKIATKYIVVDLPPLQDSSMEVVKFVEMEALKDALNMMRLMCTSCESYPLFNELKELIK